MHDSAEYDNCIQIQCQNLIKKSLNNSYGIPNDN